MEEEEKNIRFLFFLFLKVFKKQTAKPAKPAKPREDACVFGCVYKRVNSQTSQSGIIVCSCSIYVLAGLAVYLLESMEEEEKKIFVSFYFCLSKSF